MSNINPYYNDRVRYTLKNKNFSSIIITEPIGWNDDEKEYSRHEQYHGIIAKFSNSLKFIQDGADFIQLVLDIYGINEQIELIRDEKHPITDVWTLSYSGFLDLSTWTREKNQVSVKFNSGGLETLLKSRESESVEIDRMTTIDGKAISTELSTINVPLEGRRIFLKSKWKINAANNSTVTFNESDDGNFRSQTVGIPFQLVNKSHEEASSVSIQSTGNIDNGTTGMMFFLEAERPRTFKLKILNLKFRFSKWTGGINYARFDINLTKFNGGVNYYPIERISLFSLGEINAIENANGIDFTVPDYETTITLLAGESLSVEHYQHVDFKRSNNAVLQCTLSNISGELFLDENSFYEKTTTKAILAHEIGERLISIATNQEKAFYSDFLGRTDLGYKADGKGGFIACTHGFWVRGFDNLPFPTTEEPIVQNLFKPFTTSFRDFFSSFEASWSVGLGIEKFGFSEVVRMEELSYFYNQNVTIRLPNQVKNVKRTIAVDKYYSSLAFGYNQGGDYEEACGLDEYNAQSKFTTIINRIKNVYSKISEYRADSYGMEFTRRKQKSLNDTEDTSRDDAIWFLDLFKNPSGLFEQRKWFNKYDNSKNDFEVEPSGTFSPETATNLRFSPVNCLLRHSWWFSGNFKRYLSEYVRYASSTANSQLKTKLVGKNEYSESGNILNSELLIGKFVPEEIEFEHVCNFEVIQQVNGFSVILGKKVMNFYGLVEFTNEKNEIEKGFLINLKPNGKGMWKLLKSNR